MDTETVLLKHKFASSQKSHIVVCHLIQPSQWKNDLF